ncbi:PR domain zinc finger protein 10 [Patella vulgata]|uniref:PR domain zinc finger protein 10 n=1 Tax=Patella vulgata TaxID=6465 RepID=UPI0021805D6A|nr:PR domain zinc finger protein 10 [Patella vulgata]XP_050415843.1 PR domain zinc finger protein 10 [Patella vulgata]XP_050415844.1 PR domain zinc finger protein 10 [Patella vulgata]
MDDQNGGDNNQVWNPPDQSQFVAVTTTQDGHENAYNDNVAIQAIAHSQYEGHYHELRPQSYFAGAYSISGSQSDLYQAVHSTYGRVSPVQEYREVPTGSEGISSYSGVQADSAQLITPSAVDSSTLNVHQGGYHMILDPGNRLVVQRVVSPADCSVSQSTLSLRPDGDEAGTSAITLQPVQTSSVDGAQYVTVQVTSMPQYASSHGEVSTTDGALISNVEHEHHRDMDSDHHVSSIGAVHANLVAEARKRHDLDQFNGEPDTTQEDLQDFTPHHSTPGPRSYLVASSDLGHGGIHSTMSGAGLGASNQVAIMDSTLDSSQLSSTHDMSMSTTSDMTLDSAMERSADSSAMPDEIAGPSVVSGNMVTGSDSALDQSFETDDYDEEDDDDDDGNKENNPQSSGIRMQPTNVRKSSRIAMLDEEQSTSSSWRKRVYVPRPYNPEELWCDECMSSYTPNCPVHRITVVQDKVVLSRAWSSLPPLLHIFRCNEIGGANNEVGVFAKKAITKMTQFGPFVGELVPSQQHLTNPKFLLMLEKADNTVGYFETSDENKCNWMMFVRPAKNFAEQNVVAYQHGQDIFFSVIKNIEPRQELKVWYAAHYGDRIGIPIHEITERDMADMDEQEYKFPCYECNKKFRSAPALQRHLVVHEETGSPRAEDEDFDETAEAKAIRKKSLASRWFKNKGKGENGESSGYQWKKKSTSIYLNKTLKKYQKRPDSEKIRRTIQSMYKRKGKETGGNEWVCMHCDLTFDNSNLLNLHTLTHAAEDVGLDEIKKFSEPIPVQNAENGGQPGDVTNGIGMENYLACPVCKARFDNKNDLIAHATQHGTSKKKLIPPRPFKCNNCWKAFGTQERLTKHMLCHGTEDSKPLQCEVCQKRLMNNSALACHMKIHSDKKYYQCPICQEGFDQTSSLKFHSLEHCVNGLYTCPHCPRQFNDFNTIRKHMKQFHSDQEFPCPSCDKVFSRPDKLKLHMLKHSTHREFMCENCGRQFKRKDKLKEHIKRMHTGEREPKPVNAEERDKQLKKFIPKVSPTDYHRFIYKCHTCLLGFKRRGMLVNHLAKRHPDITPDLVPELNLPILKTQRDYFCQYCDKVYKSSSKRKAHIIKNHPGFDLPVSSRKKSMIPEIPGLPNPTYSQTVGSITTLPQQCTYCHKQYASKAKLMQHQRKKHPDLVPPTPDKRRVKEDIQLIDQNNLQHHQMEPATYTDVTVATQQTHDLQAADLLTQAMSELTQTLQEYRPSTGGDYHALAARIAQGVQGPTMVHVQPAQLQQLQHTTIELSHLGPALAHAQLTTSQPQHLVSAATLLTSSQQQQPQQPPPSLSPQPQPPQAVPVSLVVTNPPNQGSTVNLSQNFVPRTWTNYQNYR